MKLPHGVLFAFQIIVSDYNLEVTFSVYGEINSSAIKTTEGIKLQQYICSYARPNDKNVS